MQNWPRASGDSVIDSRECSCASVSIFLAITFDTRLVGVADHRLRHSGTGGIRMTNRIQRLFAHAAKPEAWANALWARQRGRWRQNPPGDYSRRSEHEQGDARLGPLGPLRAATRNAQLTPPREDVKTSAQEFTPNEKCGCPYTRLFFGCPKTESGAPVDSL